MGQLCCCCSDCQPEARRPRDGRSDVQIGAPQDVTIQIPRNRNDPQGVPIQQVTRDIDQGVLRAALDHVSQFMERRNRHLSVIAVGGAVNTLYLRSRATTHDVDVFGSDFGNESRILLDAAMHDAQQHIPELGTDWLNTETQLWMPGRMHDELTQMAREQNVQVYHGRGLTILAAPWAYAFTAKLSRILLGGAHARSYDLADAVTYIHEYIRAHGNQPVPIATVFDWARRWHHEITDDLLRNRVDPEYVRRYGRHAFTYD
ncbi:uncharacterized protein THITE_53192 [Thermothielavioides terrestris NRRL 8126]|uniref:DUF7582 domain-containing protein n=1 Tax=Thermothielavioides terrestris (strain ATCC 38088 / NRRL 8126) TaxID=578455 RepID=G2R628_THETT|nr:uncharacterized protein THITE_53192 [Thermothielavioides terrestris NRRL 8126]AEO67565.1 hypothetical protein THITE_53192 [Thermothielavioides terrestris NRRL 8126]